MRYADLEHEVSPSYIIHCYDYSTGMIPGSTGGLFSSSKVTYQSINIHLRPSYPLETVRRIGSSPALCVLTIVSNPYLDTSGVIGWNTAEADSRIPFTCTGWMYRGIQSISLASSQTACELTILRALPMGICLRLSSV